MCVNEVPRHLGKSQGGAERENRTLTLSLVPDFESGASTSSAISAFTRPFLKNGVPKGIRTPVTAVKGQCPRPLDDRDEATYKTHFWWS
jgi:hypothetical protein